MRRKMKNIEAHTRRDPEGESHRNPLFARPKPACRRQERRFMAMPKSRF
jgi:hypothetical protein